jgi:hypothetical protein
MVKTPKMRHSKTRREPLTIELEPDAVSRVDAAEPQADDSPVATEADDRQTAETSAFAEPERESEPETAYQASDAGGDEARPSTFQGSDHGRQASAPAASTGGGALSRILAGVAGGLVALVLAGLLQYLGLLGAPGTGDQAVRSELDALKAQVSAIGGQAGDTSRIDGLAAALETVRTDLAALGQSGGGDAAGLQALDARVKAVEVAVAKLGQAGGAAQPADIVAISKRIVLLEAGLKASGAAAAAGDGRIAALEQLLAAMSGKLDTQAAQPKIALSIATAALKSAIERGTPFAGELETLAAIAPDAPEIATLRPYAEKGVATRETLIQEVPDASAAMIAAATPVDENAGLFDRLLHSAESLVTVRPIGSVEGTTVEAIVARMEVAVRAGDLAAAVAEFGTLPDPVKAAGAGFAERLKARVTVETLVDQAIAAAMKA